MTRKHTKAQAERSIHPRANVCLSLTRSGRRPGPERYPEALQNEAAEKEERLKPVRWLLPTLLLAVVLVPHYFKGEIYSPYQMLGAAFGPAARRTASGFFLIAGTLAAGVRIYVTCIPLQLMLGFGEQGILIAILLFVGLSLIYTYVGGVKAVIWTDAIQFLLLAGGGLFALFYIPTKLAGGWTEAMNVAATAGKLDWFNGQFSLAAPFNIWMGVIGATFQVMSSHGADQLIVQRVLSCKSVAELGSPLIR